MDLETAVADQIVEPPVVEPPPPIQEEVADMTAEGVVPEIAEVVPDVAKTPSDQAFQMSSGVHYISDYQAECQASGNADRWQDKYASGHSEATQFVQPYEGRYANEWALRKNQSASEGLEAWLKGLTIADYRAIGVAKEIDEVRDELGDQKFDSLFGSKNSDQDEKIPVAQRLSITSAAYTTPIDDQMREIAKQADLKQAGKQNDNDPSTWQSFEREPKGDQQAAEKKDKADDVVEKSPIAETKEDKTLQ